MSIKPSSSLKKFASGVRAELPILVGVAPFGMINGVLAIEAGIPALQAQAMSAIVFAGSSQFILSQLVAANTPALVMIVTVFIVNLRHALYSASVAPYIQHLPVHWKVPLAYLLTDEAYAVAILNYQRGEAIEPPQPTNLPHWFHLGAGLALWTTWQITTAMGILLGAVIPASWELDFTLALTFIALVIPNLKDRPGIGAAVSAGLTAVLAWGLPYKLGLILAAIIGVAVGMFLEGRQES